MSTVNIDAVSALIAEVAAREIQPRFRCLAAHEMREKGPGDVVTIADEQAELALTPLLMAQLPGSIVVGEEAAAKQPELLKRLDEGQYAWIVDPVDGTANFAEGKEEFCSMVALAKGDELIGAWIHLPTTGETAASERGGGVHFAGKRLPPLQPAAEPPSGIIAVGKRGGPDLVARANALRKDVRQVKSLRCAGLDYLRLARGELDFALFSGVMPWDHAPGALILEELGGRASYADGSAYRPSRALTANGVLTARSAAVWQFIIDRL